MSCQTDFMAPSCCRQFNFVGVDQGLPKDEQLHMSSPKQKLASNCSGMFLEGLGKASGTCLFSRFGEDLFGKMLAGVCHMFGRLLEGFRVKMTYGNINKPF